LEVGPEEVQPLGREVLEDPLAACPADGALHEFLVLRALAVVVALPQLAGVAERIPVARAQLCRFRPPHSAAILEVHRPFPVDVPVDRGLSVDGDVLVQRGAPALGLKPGEAALRIIAAGALPASGGGCGGVVGRWGGVSHQASLLSAASAAIVNLS